MKFYFISFFLSLLQVMTVNRLWIKGGPTIGDGVRLLAYLSVRRYEGWGGFQSKGQKKWDSTESRLVNLKSNTMKNTMQSYGFMRGLQIIRQKNFIFIESLTFEFAICYLYVTKSGIDTLKKWGVLFVLSQFYWGRCGYEKHT